MQTSTGPSLQSRRPRLLVSVAFMITILMVVAAGCGSASTSSASLPTTTATAATKLSFPPKSLAAFRAFAATGDVNRVHQIVIVTHSEGQPSCPSPNIYVTVSHALTGKALEADLSAFFVQKGLLNGQCQAFVYAYHSKSDYQMHQNDGYTAGRVALTVSGSQRNLEVDTGEVTSETYNQQSEFDFNF